MLLQLIWPDFVLNSVFSFSEACQRRVGPGYPHRIIGPVAQSVRAGDS